MSADDGWIIRKNQDHKYVLQHHFISNDSYPPIEDARSNVFDTLEEALNAHFRAEMACPSEYGLRIFIETITPNSKGTNTMIATTKFARKPFHVDAVQVTEENMAQVAEWCNGEVRVDAAAGDAKHIHVRVSRPLNERQTKAYVGDWILYAGTGYKVYTNKAFAGNFESVSDVPQELRTVDQNVFEQDQPSGEEIGAVVQS
jgi:hypothetical protein